MLAYNLKRSVANMKYCLSLLKWIVNTLALEPKLLHALLPPMWLENKMIRKYIVVVSILLVIGCNDPVKVSPDRLPNAYIHQPYQTNIEITGGTVVDLNFHSEVSDASFTIMPSIAEGGYKDYNLLTVTGTPTTLDPIYIYVTGDTYGTNFPGERFKKEYTIAVKTVQ